ncbi:hypothetical protein [Pseudomonas sp. Marseille-Q7302]
MSKKDDGKGRVAIRLENVGNFRGTKNTFIGIDQILHATNTDNIILEDTLSLSNEVAIQFANLQNAVKDAAISASDKAEILDAISKMKSHVGQSEPFRFHYQKFIQSAANHMSVVSPFIPFLTTLLL